MTRRSATRRPRTHVRRRKRDPVRSSLRWGRRLVPSARTRRRVWRSFRRASPTVQIGAVFAALFVLWAVVNGVYQVLRKPTELFFPVSGVLYKTPAETWSSYGSIFRRHSTPTISAEFLAALAQVEASGNPVARTYWRWSWALHPLEVYRPASSAVGMYQITDGTFDEASRYCIHDHAVAEEGPWYAWRSCWLNELYFRVVPSHSVELTAAYLDRAVARTLARHGIGSATVAQKQTLAALIHLCGAGTANGYARRGLHLAPGLRCGDHSAAGYIARVQAQQRVFAALAAAERD